MEVTVRGGRLVWMWMLACAVVLAPGGQQAPARAQGAAASDPCALADALLKADEKAEARKAYVAVLKEDPSAACASDSLKKMNAAEASQCGAADAKFDTGDIDGARAQYEGVGKQVACAAAGLKAITEVQRLCDQGTAYLGLHRDADALAAYKSALEKNPKLACAMTGVKQAGPWGPSRWLDTMSTALPKILLTIGLVVLAVFLVLLLGYFRPTYRLLVGVPVLRRIFNPTMTFEALDDTCSDVKIAAPMASRIRERLIRFREEALGDEADEYDLDFGRPDEEFAELVSENKGLRSSLDKVRDLSDQTKLVGALLDFVYGLLPVRRLTISGVIEPPTGNQPSATLGLEDGARLVSAVTLTGSSLQATPEASDYLGLADPAAVWVQYAVAQVLSRGRIDTNAAASYALVREGLDRHLEGNDVQARIAYKQALVLDPHNWAARVNLAITEARIAKNFDRSTEILKEARDEMERAG